MKKPESIHEYVINSIYLKLDIENNSLFIFSLINRDNITHEKVITSLSKGTIGREVLTNARHFIKYAKGKPFPEEEIDRFMKSMKKSIKKYFVRMNRYKIQRGTPKIRRRDELYD